jgi:anti-sigma B factor antagonist
MDINIKTVGQVTVVEAIGDIDGKTAPEVREQVSAQIQSGAKIILDMSQVGYMSSAGLRMLLATYRQVKSSDGHVVLVGVSEEIQDTMSMTGFLRFFTICETVEAGLEALK